MKRKITVSNGNGRIMPPMKEHVVIYFLQKEMNEDTALQFYEFYQKMKWHNENGQIIKSWKTLACDYIYEFKRLSLQAV